MGYFMKRNHYAGLFVALSLAAAGPATAATLAGDLPAGWTYTGNAGSGTPDGDVSAPPVPGKYAYVSTDEGVAGVGALAGVGGSGSPTNGTVLTTAAFDAAEGDTLNFYFNYVTSDGAGYADYAWARLLDDTASQVALLFTARTVPGGGDTVPGTAMPLPEATLVPASTPIIANATEWSALGTNSGSCYSGGCGSTGWVQSLFDIAVAGSYQLQFGVTNWNDQIYDSGMAIAGVKVGDTVIQPPEPNDPGVDVIPLPAAGWMLIGAIGGLGALRRRRR